VPRHSFKRYPIMSANSSNASIRLPAVAGFFYPGNRAELSDMVSELIARASVSTVPRTPKAYIVPHAGYVYSGSTAAVAYAMAAGQRSTVRRVILIGPSHRVYLEGAAVPNVQAFATPLGEIPIDQELKRSVLDVPGVIESDHPHRLEHSLEVQLPFLQLTLGDFTLLPIVVGNASAQQVGAMLNALWGDRDTLVLASSDLSHYHPYRAAQTIDAQTSSAILDRRSTLTGEQACGAVAINGLLHCARVRNLEVTELARCNSGDTAGDKDRVVGYGAYALYETVGDNAVHRAVGERSA
jgi:MEMO1 family protein